MGDKPVEQQQRRVYKLSGKLIHYVKGVTVSLQQRNTWQHLGTLGQVDKSGTGQGRGGRGRGGRGGGVDSRLQIIRLGESNIRQLEDSDLQITPKLGHAHMNAKESENEGPRIPV